MNDKSVASLANLNSLESQTVLVSTEWVQEHLQDANVRIIESNEDELLFPSGHIPGAQEIDWIRDLNHPLRRDYLGPQEFGDLLSKLGISPDTTVVFYGDKNNWWATYAFWVFKLFGHNDCRIMNGGRLKWELEKRPLSREKVSYPKSNYVCKIRDDHKERAFRDEVLRHCQAGGQLVDVRSPEEFSGKKMHMEGYPNEGALRGGHIPGAINVPWAAAINPVDGTFKSPPELQELYLGKNKLQADKEVITYCRIGERSSHSWFVLRYLLGFENVRNYDGSWTEWGNLVNAPIEK